MAQQCDHGGGTTAGVQSHPIIMLASEIEHQQHSQGEVIAAFHSLGAFP